MSEDQPGYAMPDIETRAQHWRDQVNRTMIQRHILSLAATWRCLEPLLPAARDMLGRQHQQHLVSLGALSPGEMLAHLPTYGAVLDRIGDGGAELTRDLEDLWHRLQALHGEGEHSDGPTAA